MTSSHLRSNPAIATAFLGALALAASAGADEVRFNVDNNAWAGNPNLGVYPLNSSAVIDYEVFVEIEDIETDGPDTQGLHGFGLDVLTDTGLSLPAPEFSPTNLTAPATIDDVLWSGPGSWTGGFGMNVATSLGTPFGDDRLAIGAFGGFTPPLGTFPFMLTAIGYGAPNDPGRIDSGGNPFPYVGAARDKWYLLRGQVNVPDAGGLYTLSIAPSVTNVIRIGIDLNDDITAGWVESATVTSAVMGDSFSFQVIPEPAAIGLLLARAAFLARRPRA